MYSLYWMKLSMSMDVIRSVINRRKGNNVDSQVETVSESYVISCGVPYANEFDAEVIADTCLHMLSKVCSLLLRQYS